MPGLLGCSVGSKVPQPGVPGTDRGTRGLPRDHCREARRRGKGKSQFVGLQQANGEVLCRTCYCGRSHSSSLGLVCSGTLRIHTTEKYKAITHSLTHAKGSWDVMSSEAEH